jgi:acyl carrier protein
MIGRLAAQRLVAEALAVPAERVAADSDLARLPEWDSLGHARVVLALERTLGRLLDPAEVGGLRGVADIDRLLAAGAVRS